MSRWFSLARKEWMGLRWTMLIAALAILAADGYIAYKAPAWASNVAEESLAIGLSFIPFAGLFIASLIAGYLAMRSEWQQHTSLRLLSYPVSGTGVVLAKVAVNAAALTVLAIIAGLGTWLVARRSPIMLMTLLGAEGPFAGMEAWEIWVNVLSMVVMGLSWLVCVIAAGAFAFVVGTLVPRIAGLVSALVYAVMVYLTGLYGSLALYLSSFLPNMPFIVYSHGALGAERFVIPVIPIWPLVVASVVMILVAGRLLDKEVDA
ncbi:MAG: ABC-2 family transporter protein [Firmicutes bacterium ADurb.Bin506]|jgi:hypothetical protein|nr:MAG: ABC-2 family transporter protein [Firmicutes bacterium ADurb.Bin506]